MIFFFFFLGLQNVVKGQDQMFEEFGHYQLLFLMSIWKARRHTNQISLLEVHKEFFVSNTIFFKM